MHLKASPYWVPYHLGSNRLRIQQLGLLVLRCVSVKCLFNSMLASAGTRHTTRMTVRPCTRSPLRQFSTIHWAVCTSNAAKTCTGVVNQRISNITDICCRYAYVIKEKYCGLWIHCASERDASLHSVHIWVREKRKWVGTYLLSTTVWPVQPSHYQLLVWTNLRVIPFSPTSVSSPASNRDKSRSRAHCLITKRISVYTPRPWKPQKPAFLVTLFIIRGIKKNVILVQH